MADDREQVALDLAAQFVLAGLTTLSQDYRLLLVTQGMAFSDSQWNQIGERVRAATPMPDAEEFAAAYEFLDARADAE